MSDPVTLYAPWTDEQVASLNAFQDADVVHPFTCARRSEPGHVEREGKDKGQLIATPEGWVCPDCDYTQNWTHPAMADGSFVEHVKLNWPFTDNGTEVQEGQ